MGQRTGELPNHMYIARVTIDVKQVPRHRGDRRAHQSKLGMWFWHCIKKVFSIARSHVKIVVHREMTETK